MIGLNSSEFMPQGEIDPPVEMFFWRQVNERRFFFWGKKFLRVDIIKPVSLSGHYFFGRSLERTIKTNDEHNMLK